MTLDKCDIDVGRMAYEAIGITDLDCDWCLQIIRNASLGDSVLDRVRTWTGEIFYYICEARK